jgi:hypothetical protein
MILGGEFSGNKPLNIRFYEVDLPSESSPMKHKNINLLLILFFLGNPFMTGGPNPLQTPYGLLLHSFLHRFFNMRLVEPFGTAPRTVIDGTTKPVSLLDLLDAQQTIATQA